jgi:hypothetical protein
MRGAYKVLANIIALLIVVQAAAMVWLISGLFIYVDEGGTFDKAVAETLYEGDSPVNTALGLIVHSITGMMIIPLLTLALFIVSFFAKVPRGIPVATVLLILVIVQVVLGIAGYSISFAGLLHGVNALLLFAGALHAARLPNKVVVVEKREPATTATA